ncbi:LytR/AlgR family response regulator transcription factor [Flavobacterium sp.]|uniref:LytR/AlgR family response regulator transcription factor n=1 Tax=Flavobacterium sp. TaxID=239 RepID=UPI003F69737B
MRKLSALIIEDESENISLLELYLKKYFKEIETIFSSNRLDEGTSIFLEHRPDILFLDIKLDDDTTSFELLDKYNIGNAQVIFITSHEKFALRALNRDNVSAYLIKPIIKEELINAVTKTISKFNLEVQNKSSNKESNTSNFIAVSSIDKIDLIKEQDIISCSAHGTYTVIKTKNKEYTSSRNLGLYEELLSPSSFFRIHHKHIVNLNHIKFINKMDGYFCEMKNGDNLPISKRNQEKFSKFIKLKL